jgi:formate C-acetyltransferase
MEVNKRMSGISSRWQASQLSAVRGELEAYYAGFPTPLSSLEAALHEIHARHPGGSPFRMKAAGYQLMAEHCPVKVFRHYPFYFEIDVSKPRTDLGSGGIGGWMRGTPFGAQLTDQGNNWHGPCGACGLSWGWPVMDDNHLCLGNDVVFQFGLNGLIRQAKARQARASSDIEREFLDAVIAGNCALLRIADRLAAEAERMLAGESEPAVRARLARIAATARRVPGEPPETFFEAANTLLFMRETVQCWKAPGSACSDTSTACCGRSTSEMSPAAR